MQVVVFSVHYTKVRNLRHFSPRSKQILVRMGWDGIVLKHDPAKLLLSHCTKIAQWGLNLFLGSGLLTPVPKFIPWHHSSIIVATKANPYKNHSLVRFQSWPSYGTTFNNWAHFWKDPSLNSYHFSPRKSYNYCKLTDLVFLKSTFPVQLETQEVNYAYSIQSGPYTWKSKRSKFAPFLCLLPRIYKFLACCHENHRIKKSSPRKLHNYWESTTGFYGKLLWNCCFKSHN